MSDHFFQSLNPPYLTDGSRYLARLNFPKYLTAETQSAQRISLLPNRETTIGQKSPGLNLSLIRSDKESFCLLSSPDKQKMPPLSVLRASAVRKKYAYLGGNLSRIRFTASLTFFCLASPLAVGFTTSVADPRQRSFRVLGSTISRINVPSS